jgi:hypothetical protein
VKHFTRIAPIFVILLACSSAPVQQGPAWIHQPARTVDNGYIVYVASAISTDTEKAQFKAEGLALEDLANECSFVPKGTRVEDRYVEKKDEKAPYTAYVKLGLEFQECDKAQKTIEPTEIKKLASLPFAEQLKRYQDYDETGEMSGKTEVAQVEPLKEIPPAPAADPHWASGMHFYVTRQYVAYQKEVVILSPPATYAVASPESHAFVQSMTAPTAFIQKSREENPTLKNQPQTWSQLAHKPNLQRPGTLAPKNHPRQAMKEVPAERYEPHSNSKNHEGGHKKKRRRHGGA